MINTPFETLCLLQDTIICPGLAEFFPHFHLYKWELSTKVNIYKLKFLIKYFGKIISPASINHSNMNSDQKELSI